METKETVIETNSSSNLIENADYFRYIFKKTEKIACAVFYILRSSQNIRHDDVVVVDVEDAAQRLLHVSLDSLKSSSLDIFEKAIDIKHALVACEAKLRVANAALIVSSELLEVFVHEIDSVQRSLRKYTESSVLNPLEGIELGTKPTSERRQSRHRISTAGAPVNRTSGGAHTQGRRDRVLNVIRDKQEATIKDITDVVTDCSEKTIQRELISLIKDNVIVREGERRWSKYKLV